MSKDYLFIGQVHGEILRLESPVAIVGIDRGHWKIRVRLDAPMPNARAKSTRWFGFEEIGERVTETIRTEIEHLVREIEEEGRAHILQFPISAVSAGNHPGEKLSTESNDRPVESALKGPESRKAECLRLLSQIHVDFENFCDQLNKTQKSILRLALDAWPFGVQEFDRVAVELYGIPPGSVADVRKTRLPSTVYRSVEVRYPHMTDAEIAAAPKSKYFWRWTERLRSYPRLV